MNDSLLYGLDDQQISLLRDYSKAIAESPTWLGMTAANERPKFWERHVLDALAMIQAFPSEWRGEHWKVADAGTGNGIPGFPIAIVNRNWSLTLIDSDNKKVGFIEQFCNLNGIKYILFLSERLEIIGQSEMRESYDLVISRALSKLRTSLEITSPLAKVGGRLIVSHGTSWANELQGAEKTMRDLNVKFERAIPYDKGGNRVILQFSKEKRTPDQYPRRPGVPARKPL